jgi:hypothetical protein
LCDLRPLVSGWAQQSSERAFRRSWLRSRGGGRRQVTGGSTRGGRWVSTCSCVAFFVSVCFWRARACDEGGLFFGTRQAVRDTDGGEEEGASGSHFSAAPWEGGREGEGRRRVAAAEAAGATGRSAKKKKGRLRCCHLLRGAKSEGRQAPKMLARCSLKSWRAGQCVGNNSHLTGRATEVQARS